LTAAGAVDDLLPLVYAELRKLAQAYLQEEDAGHTLQATALVHEAYLKLIDQRTAGWHDRQQFLGVAAQAMRRILVDHARARGALKRGSPARRLPLDDMVDQLEHSATDLVRLDAALQDLNEIAPQKARVVELRFFGGLSVDETAAVLGVSKRTVERDWTFAKAWLHANLSESP
jgi:RNA polymerase sigma factor (TIGR02999 family)